MDHNEEPQDMHDDFRNFLDSIEDETMMNFILNRLQQLQPDAFVYDETGQKILSIRRLSHTTISRLVDSVKKHQTGTLPQKRFRESSDDGYELKKQFSEKSAFEGLDCSVLLKIAQNLDPQNYVAFASVSRQLRQCLNTGRYNPNEKEALVDFLGDVRKLELANLSSVRKYTNALYFIKNPSKQVQLAAVTRDGNAIEYIRNPSEEVQLTAVRQNALAIEYIENPYEKVQLAAVFRNVKALKFIKNPTEKVQLLAINKYIGAIKYIQNPTDRVQLEAVMMDGYNIKYIKNPSEQVQLAAVTQEGDAIRYIDNPSEQVQLAAFN